MIISIINHSNGKLTDAEIQTVICAINRQVKEDYESYWSLGATLRLEGHSNKSPNTQSPADMRGDAVIYLWDKSNVDDAIGYHVLNNRGIPFGFVFLDIAEELGEEWSVTLSHEALELIGDPEVNLPVAGPHPDPSKKRNVFHWYEMCDAVQTETYKIDGISVSNFILSLYFTGGDEFDGRNDFLGSSLKSFGVNPGDYVGFFDPEKDDHDTYSKKGDATAKKRMQIKSKVKGTRRAIRYQRHAHHLPYKLAIQESK
ncbi:MAG TPA: hypothetical protein VGQ09_17050 [Chitinophagaceae bacterium]|jgi:hypothetical protein|nr:hypothetical protein [Chitinophagaceae bacterium]